MSTNESFGGNHSRDSRYRNFIQKKDLPLEEEATPNLIDENLTRNDLLRLGGFFVKTEENAFAIKQKLESKPHLHKTVFIFNNLTDACNAKAKLGSFGIIVVIE